MIKREDIYALIGADAWDDYATTKGGRESLDMAGATAPYGSHPEEEGDAEGIITQGGV